MARTSRGSVRDITKIFQMELTYVRGLSEGLFMKRDFPFVKRLYMSIRNKTWKFFLHTREEYFYHNQRLINICKIYITLSTLNIQNTCDCLVNVKCVYIT